MARGKQRSIFEEVGTEARAPAPTPGAIDRARRGARGGIRIWLMVLFALVVVMILVGGLTRLTGSGLSITEWRPVTGAIPPLTHEVWLEEFEKYRQIPQYQILNRGMTLDEFKVIYWWEWGHRQLGRLIGLVWALGFLGFLIARRIPPGWMGRLLGLGLLGGAQGALGWWMVASGLGEGMVAVASYRLAAHLGLAFVILGLIAWYVFRLGRAEAELIQARRVRAPAAAGLGAVLVVAGVLQILLGALVAGIEAGRGYTDWPLMNGHILPPEAFELEPLWRNAFENMALVQFLHRVGGYVVVLLGLSAWAVALRAGSRGVRRAHHWMALALLAQLALGIVTLMQGAPWELAIAHQALAIILWVTILRARFLALYPPAQSSIRSSR